MQLTGESMAWGEIDTKLVKQRRVEESFFSHAQVLPHTVSVLSVSLTCGMEWIRGRRRRRMRRTRT